MQRFLGTAAAIFASASSAIAVRLNWEHVAHAPGSKLESLAGESYEVNKRGEFVLLRAPMEMTKPPILRVSAHFSSLEGAPCEVFADTLTLKGDALGNLTLRLSFTNGSLHMKASSSSPAYAGPWRSLRNYTGVKSNLEAMPDSFKMVTAAEGMRVLFYVGHGDQFKLPMIKVKPGLRAGLDVSMSNLQAFNLSKLSGLLGSFKHNKTIEEASPACKVASTPQRKATSAEVDHEEDILAVQSTTLRNLVHEKFTMNQAGSFPLLRVPKVSPVPLIQVKGSFVTNADAPCVVFLQRVTLLGTWFGNKTVHVGSQSDTLTIKVSSPKFAGGMRSIKEFNEVRNSREGLPGTAKITSSLDGSPSFRFQLGPGKLSNRANILVTRTSHGGLDISVTHMERTNQTVIGGLLGTDKFPKSVEDPAPDCKGKSPKPQPKVVDKPIVGGGSLITASWAP